MRFFHCTLLAGVVVGTNDLSTRMLNLYQAGIGLGDKLRPALHDFKPIEAASYAPIVTALKEFNKQHKKEIEKLTADILANKNASKEQLVKVVEKTQQIWLNNGGNDLVIYDANECEALDQLERIASGFTNIIESVNVRIRLYHNKDRAKLESVQKEIRETEKELRQLLVAIRDLARALRTIAGLKMPQSLKDMFGVVDELKAFAPPPRAGWLAGAVSILVASAVGVFFLK